MAVSLATTRPVNTVMRILTYKNNKAFRFKLHCSNILFAWETVKDCVKSECVLLTVMRVSGETDQVKWCFSDCHTLFIRHTPLTSTQSSLTDINPAWPSYNLSPTFFLSFTSLIFHSFLRSFIHFLSLLLLLGSFFLRSFFVHLCNHSFFHSLILLFISTHILRSFMYSLIQFFLFFCSILLSR